MADEGKKQNRLKSWGKGLKSEFQKIVWLDRDTVGRQTTAVCIVSVILAFIIAVLDMLIKHGVDILVKL